MAKPNKNTVSVVPFSPSLLRLYVCPQLAKVWLKLIQLKEEEAADKKELVQLLQQMTQLLLECHNEEGQDNEIQQHVRLLLILGVHYLLQTHKNILYFVKMSLSLFVYL